MSMASTERLLHEWAGWVRVGQVIPRYMSPITALYLRNVEQLREPEPAISEAVAMVIDQAVARLKQRDTEIGEAIELHYLCRLSIRQCASAMDMDRRRLDGILNAGVAWIDGALEAA